MAARAAGRGSGHGIDRTILETGLGNTGAVLAADLPEAGRRQPDVGSAPSCPGAVQSRAARAQAGFPRCRATGEAAGGTGADLELCARRRTATVVIGDAQKVPVD